MAKIRAALLHLGQNMWGEYLAPGETRDPSLRYTGTRLRMNESVWRELTALMQRRRYTHAVIDLGEGMVFPSHPELAVEGSWSADRMRAEVARLKAMGIEAIPKLNFSTCHDGWLKEYGRMVATPKYYEVVRDVIADACAVFGSPRYFHLGLDEESPLNQRGNALVVVRQGELLWHDIFFYLDCLERQGARPIAFTGGLARSLGDEFYRRMPKTVIDNVGMYGHGHDRAKLLAECARRKEGPGSVLRLRAQTFDMLERMAKEGRDILSCTSNYVSKGKLPKSATGENYPQDRESVAWLHALLKRTIPDEHYLGGMVAPWGEIFTSQRHYWESAINQLADAWDGV